MTSEAMMTSGKQIKPKLEIHREPQKRESFIVCPMQYNAWDRI